MAEDNNSNPTGNGNRSPDRTINRRRLLKTTGVTLASLSLPASTAAAKRARSHSVDPSDRDSVIEFVKRLDDASETEAREMWTALSEKKAEELMQAIDELSYAGDGQATLVAKDGNGDVIARKTGSPDVVEASSLNSATVPTDMSLRTMSFEDQSVTAQAQEYTYTDSVPRKTATVTLYVMTSSLTWVTPTTSQAYPSSGSSSGDGKVPYWIDIQEITGTLSTQGSYAQTTRERRYKHDNPASTTYYTARMVLQGSPGGSGVTVTEDPTA